MINFMLVPNRNNYFAPSGSYVRNSAINTYKYIVFYKITK